MAATQAPAMEQQERMVAVLLLDGTSCGEGANRVLADASSSSRASAGDASAQTPLSI
jgi:hypothetical protein